MTAPPPDEPATLDRKIVKDLFGLLLDADEAEADGAADAAACRERAEIALERAPKEVREAAERLLASHQRAKTSLFVETFTVGGSPRGWREVEASFTISPPEIPGYRIDGELGRGGFGIVYRAQQLEPVQRPVAVKLLRTEFATPETAARFRAETAVLARMNHESIARVLDAGLDQSGRPFVVMELIDGQPLTRYCEERGLSVRERVQLFIRVCDAVHHVHQRAVIHRDLKPGNILVEEVDGHPRPRLIDFGIAKLLEDRGPESITREGHRIGTPRYMSPEQRRGQAAADIRIDVYALGVLLCETLTGKVPFAETDDDDERSRRSTTRGTKPSTLAAGADPEVASRARELKGDLDRIVLMAVSPEPALRYTSAAALAEDLRRYLAGKPVEATPPGWVYLTRKFIARRKGTSAAVALAVLSLAAGGTSLTLGLRQARESTRIVSEMLDVSDRARLRADAVVTFLMSDVMGSLNPNITGRGEPRVRDVLRYAAAMSEHTLSDQPDLRVELLQRIGTAQRMLSDFGGAAESLHLAVRVGTAHGVLNEATLIELRLEALLAQLSSQQLDGATEQMQAILDDSTRLLGAHHQLTLRSRLHAAHILGDGQPADEMQAIVRAMEAQGLAGAPVYLEGLRYLGAALAQAGRDDDALVLRRAADMTEARYGSEHVETIEALVRLGVALARNGKPEAADEVFRRVKSIGERVFGLGSIFTQTALMYLTELALSRDDYQEAHDFGRLLVESLHQSEKLDTPQHVMCLQLLGEAEYGIGYFGEARRTFTRVLQIREMLGTGLSPVAMNSRAWLVESMLALDHIADIDAVAAVVLEHASIDDAARHRTAIAQAEALRRLQRLDEARALIEREHANLPIDSPFRAAYEAWLAE